MAFWRFSRVLRVALVLAVGWAVGCDREEPIRSYKALKDPPHAHRERLEWKVPGDWVEWPGDDTTYAGFTLSEKPQLEMTITALPRSASGAADVVANVNRWQRQMGMPATSPEETSGLVKEIVVDGRPVQMVDLMSKPASEAAPRTRTLAAMTVDGDRVWFFTAKGDADALEKHKKEFEEFVASLKFNAAKMAAARRETRGPLSYVIPAGWEDGGPREMRFMTYYAGDPKDPAELVVSTLGAGSFGDLLENINRWRGQVGLPPVAKEEDQPVQRMQLGGNPAAMFDMSGPGTPQRPNMRMLLAMVVDGKGVWFFKFIGSHKTVEAEKGNFEAFVKSVEFVKQ
jgi:hypothetical protein